MLEGDVAERPTTGKLEAVSIFYLVGKIAWSARALLDAVLENLTSATFGTIWVCRVRDGLVAFGPVIAKHRFGGDTVMH